MVSTSLITIMLKMSPLPEVCVILLPISDVRLFYLSAGANFYPDPEILVQERLKVVSHDVCARVHI